MALSELFGSGHGLIVGIQIVPGAGVTDHTATSAVVLPVSTPHERNVILTFVINGESYELDCRFSDETYHTRDIDGTDKADATKVQARR